jgi:hypothetical protein
MRMVRIGTLWHVKLEFECLRAPLAKTLIEILVITRGTGTHLNE